jgi:hypothetical protein
MVAMGMMQTSAHEVIDMIAMRHGFVPAGRAMLVRAARLRRALHGIGRIDRDDVFFVIRASLSGQTTVQVSHRYFGAIKNIIQQAAGIGRLLCRTWSGRMRSAP